MSPPSAKLEELGRRIERLTVAPETISRPLTRLFRPLLHRVGWKPSAETEAMRALVEGLDAARRRGDDLAPVRPRLDRARRELASNLAQVERATVLGRRPLLSQAAWLRRSYELLVHAERALRDEDPGALVLAALPDPTALLPPLAMKRARPLDDEREAPPQGRDGAPVAALPPAPEEAAARQAPLQADPARVLELQLDTVDHLLAAARDEDARLDRRRRLLDAARQLLLETSAALELDPDGVQARLQGIARQITRINRLEAAGLQANVALLHQARRALSRGERDRLFAALSELRRGAAVRGDATVAGLVTDAIGRLRTEAPSDELGELSLRRSAQEVLGTPVVDAVLHGFQRGRVEAPSPRRAESDNERWVAEQIVRHYAPGTERASLAHALAVDGCFEVGGALSPVRIQERVIVRRAVPYPTPQLMLVPADGPQDLPHAVMSDPRSIIMDLAAGRLLARRFVREEVATRPRTVMQAEARIYVLDGSSSMFGPRARMRDALLVAELATLLRRLDNDDGSSRVVLYYRYFTDELGPLSRVDSAGGVIEAIDDVTGTPRHGDTDIELALVASLELIAEAQRSDPDLARAQIVLVTDGVATVDEGVVLEARQALGNLPVGISVIALGLENEALRQLVAHQRARGERAFYHFLPDEYLVQLDKGQLDADLEIHLPPVPDRRPATPMAAELEPLLEQLAELHRSRQTEARREIDRMDRERMEVEVEVGIAGEGQRARLEALYRDDRALDERFESWFPAPELPNGQAKRPPPELGTLERDDLDSMVVVLTSIAEVLETVQSTGRERKADAIELLDRLLPDARLSVARYRELLRAYPAELAAAVSTVRR